MVVFRPILSKKLYQWGLNHLSQKGLDNICHRFWLRHLPSGRDILTTVSPNPSRSESMETRHPKIYRDIKFEEIRAQKCLQTAAWKSNQKSKKSRNSHKLEYKWEAMWWCSRRPSHSLHFFLFFISINTPPFFQKKI